MTNQHSPSRTLETVAGKIDVTYPSGVTVEQSLDFERALTGAAEMSYQAGLSGAPDARRPPLRAQPTADARYVARLSQQVDQVAIWAWHAGVAARETMP